MRPSHRIRLHRPVSRLGALAVALGLCLSHAPSTASEPDSLYEARLVEKLAAGDPEAARFFGEASRAFYVARDLAAADSLFVQVLARQPEFTPALRRMSYVKLYEGHRPEAIALARDAISLEPSWENLNALAGALATGEGDAPPSSAEIAEARELAHRAAIMAQDDPAPSFTMCRIAVASMDAGLLDTYSAALEKMAPREVGTWVYRAMAHAVNGRRGAVAPALDHARSLGLAEEDYRSLRQQLLPRTAPERLLRTGGLAVAVWVGLILLLVALGAALSAATLQRVRSMKGRAAASGRAGGADRALRATYGVVLWLACVLFYVSIPLLLLVVLALGGGLLYAMFALGHIPIKLALIVLVLTAVTVFAVIRSLFARGGDDLPGEPLDPAQAPRLVDLLGRVAARIGTRPVDRIYLTPRVDLAVMERGGFMRQLSGTGERCLILGIGVLDGFRIGPFKAVLAHEYGHFTNRDTAGGGFALAVRRSVLTMAQRLAEGGAAGWFNPAWWFVNGFHRAFLRISQGASRLQEILADRWAAMTCGADAFARGLRHVIERSIRFDALLHAAATDAAERGRPVANLYAHAPAQPVADGQIEDALAAALAAEPSPYDSHPSPADRFEWTRALEVPEPPAEPEDENPVWSLFDDREALEQRMTETVSRFLAARYGIDLAGGGRVGSEPQASPAGSD